MSKVRLIRFLHFRFLLLVLFTSILCVMACTDDKVQAPDVSDIDGSFDFTRFDHLVAQTDTLAIIDSLDNWQAKFPVFTQIYINNVLGIPTQRLSQEELRHILAGFISNEGIQELQGKIDSVFSQTNDIEEEFEMAFQFMKYYFPEKQTPSVFTYNSEYSIQRFLFVDEEGKDGLGIGLDLFLGSTYPYRSYMPDLPVFSDYLVRTYNKEHIVKRCMEAMVEDWMGTNKGGKLLDQMIYYGKQIYILDQLLPYHSDTIIMEYTPEQLQWCEDNELQMWAFMLNNELFYSNDINKISKLVNPSPTSTGMPEESPGRTGNYMGWQIVKSFMKKNPEMSLQELIDYQDSQKILEISRFKPKRK